MPRVLLITGASRGIGAATAVLAAEPEVIRMRDVIAHFVATWLPC